MPNKEQRIDHGYYIWRKNIVARDGGVCQFPKCTSSKDIEVHHIFRYSDNPSLRTNEDNGISLCKVHHKFITGQEEYFAFIFLEIVKARKKQNEDNSGHKRTETT